MTGARIAVEAIHQGGGVGGAPVSLLKLLGSLDASTFAPRATFTEPGPILSYASAQHVPASVVPTGGAFFYSAHARLSARGVARFLRGYPAAVLTAQRHLRRSRPDLLHLNTSVLLPWATAAARERVPVLWMAREVLGPNPVLRSVHSRFMLRHARRVVAISGAVRDCFPVSARVEVIPNAVDLREFSLALLGERAAIRAEIGVDVDERVIMAVGSVQLPKGHWLLLDAFEQLHRRDPRARLVLVCGGVDPSYRQSRRGRLKQALGLPMDALDALLRDAARRGLQGQITVTGFRRDVARILAAADVLAFPSLEPEGFGRPLIEAMAMARPVVATAVGPSAEIVGPDSGRVVPSRAAALADAIGSILEDPVMAKRMGCHGRARVEALFSQERQTRQMERMYREVLETRD